MQRIIDEIKGCTEHQNFLAALVLALAIPDVCSSYERKILKDKKYCYSQWCNKWFEDDFKIDGKVIYALRCSMMHKLNCNIKKEPIYKKHKAEQPPDSPEQIYRFFIPGTDTPNGITYYQESKQNIKHELCISRLIYQIIFAYEAFQKAYPDFKFDFGRNWI